jgi:hypothetical protein
MGLPAVAARGHLWSNNLEQQCSAAAVRAIIQAIKCKVNKIKRREILFNGQRAKEMFRRIRA